MRCQNEMNYLAQVARDFAATLPLSARAAFEQHAQAAINTVVAELAKPVADPPAEEG